MKHYAPDMMAVQRSDGKNEDFLSCKLYLGIRSSFCHPLSADPSFKPLSQILFMISCLRMLRAKIFIGL